MRETPKELEQRRRDMSTEQHNGHNCVPIHSTSPIPTKWRAVLECQTCKQRLIQYVAQDMLTLAPQALFNEQEFVCNVSEVAYRCTATGKKLPCPRLWTNANEADQRVWLHCVHSCGTRKLIFSPDTDVYHVGLTVAPLIPRSEIFVQICKNFYT